MSAIFAGPPCPRCEAPIAESELRTGRILCGSCGTGFQATVFQPVDRHARVAEVLVATPDGVANACANHARNAAVTSCERCGLFICELCDLNLGEGSVCPSCFDRARADGTLKQATMRYRDHASMARVMVVVGFLFSMLFLGLPFGIAALYYATKGIRQRREEGTSPAGMFVIIVFAVLEIIGAFALIALMIVSLNS